MDFHITVQKDLSPWIKILNSSPMLCGFDLRNYVSFIFDIYRRHLMVWKALPLHAIDPKWWQPTTIQPNPQTEAPSQSKPKIQIQKPERHQRSHENQIETCSEMGAMSKSFKRQWEITAPSPDQRHVSVSTLLPSFRKFDGNSPSESSSHTRRFSKENSYGRPRNQCCVCCA